MINGIVRQLESLGEGEVPSEQVGELVMEGLKGLDDVAYVRFASVYKNFREAKDFEELIGAARRRGAVRRASRGRAQARADERVTPAARLEQAADRTPALRARRTSASCAWPWRLARATSA